METIAISLLEHRAFSNITNQIYSLLISLSKIDEIGTELVILDIEAPLRVMDALIHDIHTYINKMDPLREAVKYMINGSNERYLRKLNNNGHLSVLNRFIKNTKHTLKKQTNEETKDEATKDEETKDEETKDEETKDEETKDEETKDEETKDEETKDEATKDEATKDEATKDEATKDVHEKNSLLTALENVREIMDKLHLELMALKESMEYHEEKYFSYWRTNSDSTIFLEQLKIHKNIFTERMNLLMQIVALYI